MDKNMYQTESKELIQAKKLIEVSKLDEADHIIKKFEERGGQSLHDIVQCNLIKCELLAERGLFEDVIKLADKAYKESLGLGQNRLSLEFLLFKAFSLLCLGMSEQSNEIIKEVEKLFNSLTDIQPIEEKQVECYLALLKGWVYSQRGNYNKSINQFDLSLSLREEIGDKNKIFPYGIRQELSLYGIAWVYMCNSDFDRALEYSKRGIAISEEKSHISSKGDFLFIMANIHFIKGELDLSITCAKQCLGIVKRLKNRFRAARTLNILGSNYQMKGDFNRSIKFYKESLELFKKFNNKLIMANILNSLASCYRMKGELDNALNSIEQAIKIYKETSTLALVASNYQLLIQILIDKGEIERAQITFREFEQLNSNIDYKNISYMVLLSKALLLKTSSRALNRGKAEEILKSLLEKKKLYYDLRIEILLNLSELLIADLQIAHEEEILEEIKPLITQLLDSSEKAQSFWVLGETYLLQAKLALMNFELDKARRFLTQGQKVAENYGLTLLARKISHEHDELLKRLDMWKNLKESKASLTERIELARLDEQMENMIRTRAKNIPEDSTEEPVLLLIVSEGGTPFFSQSFIQDKFFEDHLFGGFFTAINSFINEKFSEGLDRASFGEYTLLMNSVSPFLLCYVYKGQSYSAQQRLKYFIEKMQNDEYVWQTFTKYYQLNKEVQLDDIPSLEPLIKEIFINKKFH
jgi:tetratricopeptide (TPR) repeat protein